MTTGLLAGFDEAGALVLFKGETGEIIDRRELSLFGTPTDLAVDVEASRLVVVLETEEAGTSILEVPLVGASLGPATKLFSALGRARIALMPTGIVVATDADGPRVHLVRADGEPSAGHALPPIRGWMSAEDRIEGLALGRDAEPERFTLALEADGAMEIARRETIGVRVEDAAWVRREEGDEWVVVRDLKGTISLGPLDASTARLASPLRALTATAGRLDSAIAWPANRLAIVTGKPPALVIASTSDDAELSYPLAVAAPSGAPYGRRDLVIYGSRLLVATKEGVLAFRAEEEPSLEVILDGAFDGTAIRGPLARLAP